MCLSNKSRFANWIFGGFLLFSIVLLGYRVYEIYRSHTTDVAPSTLRICIGAAEEFKRNNNSTLYYFLVNALEDNHFTNEEYTHFQYILKNETNKEYIKRFKDGTAKYFVEGKTIERRLPKGYIHE